MGTLALQSQEAAFEYIGDMMDRAVGCRFTKGEGVPAQELQDVLDDLAFYMDRSGASEGEHYMAFLLRMARGMVNRQDIRRSEAKRAIERGDLESATRLLAPIERYWDNF